MPDRGVGGRVREDPEQRRAVGSMGCPRPFSLLGPRRSPLRPFLPYTHPRWPATLRGAPAAPGVEGDCDETRDSGRGARGARPGTITGCSIQHDGDDSVTQRFGSDYFGAGGTLNLTETVDGDALLAGGRVSVASEVKGDLVVAGGELSLGGAVDDDLYAAGGSVQLDAIVSGNARVAGGEVTVGPATVVAGALTLTGGRVQFDGNTHGTSAPRAARCA